MLKYIKIKHKIDPKKKGVFTWGVIG